MDEKRRKMSYRGYYYDAESGFYYLKTRYYDPEVKRFLNRDCLENESNLYQYCYNNPVNYSDESGMTAYDCTDTRVVVMSSPFGSKYSASVPMTTYHGISVENTSQPYAKYILGNRAIYFNCYLWALERYSMYYGSYDAAYPGLNIKEVDKLQKQATVSNIAEEVIKDLKMLRKTVYKVSGVCPSKGAYQKALAIRTTMKNDNKWDYHFMKVNCIGRTDWSFKAGWRGCTFKIKDGKTPNQLQWNAYKYDGNIWKIDKSLIYNSNIIYIEYK